MATIKRGKRIANATPITLLFAIGTFVLIAALYLSPVDPLTSVVIALLALGITGVVIRRANGLEGTYGLYIFGGSRGIGTIRRMAHNRKRFWEFFVQVGMVLSFGFLSYFIFRGQIGKRALIVGLLLTALLMFVLFPYTSLALQFIKLPHGGNLAQQVTPSLQLSPLGYALFATSLIGGFALFFIIVLVIAAGGILSSIFTVASSIVTSQPVNYTAVLANSQPGVLPALPGITIPFFAGILSLAILLVAHEFSHGALADIYKANVRRVGLLMFGVIPVGAFVEPNEKKVNKLSAVKQNRIFIAGITANFALTFIFFALTIIMLTYVAPSLFSTHVVISATVPGSPAASAGMQVNSTLIAWNNYPVSDIPSLQSAAAGDTAFGPVNVVTNNGTYNLTANATGKIGVELVQMSLSTSTSLYASFLMFLYQLVVLSFVLNFFVALMNLMPIPGFDGWRIYKNTIKNPRALYLFSLFVVALIVILTLPWIWNI